MPVLLRSFAVAATIAVYAFSEEIDGRCEELECDLDSSDLLAQTSLLQKSIQLTHPVDQKEEEAEVTIEAAPLPLEGLARLETASEKEASSFSEGGLSDAADAPATELAARAQVQAESADRSRAAAERPAHYGTPSRLNSVAVWMMAEAADPARSIIDGVPMLLICMLAFVIGLVFIIQVVGWSLEGRDHPSDARTATRFSARPAFMVGTPGSSKSLAAWDKSARPSLQTASTTGPGYPSFHGYGDPALPAAMPPAGTVSRSLAALDQLPVERAEEPQADGSLDAICPALILPHGEAQFSIPAESIRRLSNGQYPVEILGPSGRPLLHARLPGQPVGGTPSRLGTGRWLELTTTPTSRYPHACVGPLPPGGGRQRPLEIRGPRGDAYGSLEPSGSGWSAQHGGRAVLRIDSTSGGLRALASDGSIIATALTDQGQALSVQVNPGVDALLTLLCMLAVVLISPEAAGVRV